MAEIRNKHRNGMILSDDLLKDAYKGGLDQLKASDELIKNTLDKCRMELDTGKRRMPVSVAFGRAALRYGAPVAACLLVLVILLNYPVLRGSKPQMDAVVPQPSATMDSGQAASRAMAPESASKSSQAKDDENGIVVQFSESVDGSAALTYEIPEVEDREESQILYACKPPTAEPSSLSSMDYSNFLTPVNGNLPPEAVKAVLNAYNQRMGTAYTCDAGVVLTVETLKTGGIGADSLRKASGFNELLGDQEYHLMPLQDENQEYTVLLPVVESAVPYNDPSTAPLDIVFSQSGRTWLSSLYSGIYTSNDQVEYLLSSDKHQQLVRDTFHAEQISNYRVIDINNGYDFIIIIDAGDQEYAIPLLMMDSWGPVENRKAYRVRDLLTGLADSLEAQ